MMALSSQLSKLSTEIAILINQLSVKEYITEPQKKDDDRWALIYMLLLDRKHHPESVKNFKSNEWRDPINKNWWDSWFDKGEENTRANDYYDKVFTNILFVEAPKNLPAWQLAAGEKQFNPLKTALLELRLGQPPADIAMQLGYLTLASPAICTFRQLTSFSQDRNFEFIPFYCSFQIADSFRKFFNTSENIAVVDKVSERKRSYWQNVLIYSAQGNFQSMIDEFCSSMIDHHGLWDYELPEKLAALSDIVSKNIGLRTVSIAGHSAQSFLKEDKPHHLRCHFAVAMNHAIKEDEDVVRSGKVRDAFNSPFRPFILATTSIGQEGLDFHLYCRKILHWNLPANPVDFEQREGRINRFKNLAIRQNLAKKYGSYLKDINGSTVWNMLFHLAIQHEKGNKSDLVPFWHVEPENIFIERQAPTIPYSREVKKLKDLLKTLSVYRIALGQPRQEDLVEHLIQNLTEEEIDEVQRELLINLSPYSHIAKTKVGKRI